MSVLVLKVNEVSFGIEVRGEDLTVALQAEELALQQLGTVGLWQFLHGQCPGTDDDHSGRVVGFPEAGEASWHSACCKGGSFSAELLALLSGSCGGFSSESLANRGGLLASFQASHSLGSVRPHRRPHWD